MSTITPASLALTTLSVARKAISKGWVQGTYSKFNGIVDEVCAVGGLLYAESDIPYNEKAKLVEAAETRARMFLSRAIGQLGLKEPTKTKNRHALDSYIITFNDAPGRTKSEVLKAFDRAISNAKRRHLNG